MPTGFFIWGYMYPFTFICGGTSKFLGVQSLTLHLGVQRKLTAFSPRKVVHRAVFCKYYADWRKLFFSVWHWVRQEVGFCLTHGLCVCPTILFVILYITCQILFFIQNWMQDYLGQKKICVFTVTWPTLIFASDPMHFYTEFG